MSIMGYVINIIFTDLIVFKNMLGHLMRHDYLRNVIIEGMMELKKKHEEGLQELFIKV